MSFAHEKPAEISVSVADFITHFMILQMACIGLLIGTSAYGLGCVGLSLKRECALVLLNDLGTDRYDVFLCVCRHMSLATYFTPACGFVAQ